MPQRLQCRVLIDDKNLFLTETVGPSFAASLGIFFSDDAIFKLEHIDEVMVAAVVIPLLDIARSLLMSDGSGSDVGA